MKLSKMRAKARSRFARGPGLGRIKYRYDVDKKIYDTPPVESVLCTPVTEVRGRWFTKPEVAKHWP